MLARGSHNMPFISMSVLKKGLSYFDYQIDVFMMYKFYCSPLLKSVKHKSLQLWITYMMKNACCIIVCYFSMSAVTSLLVLQQGRTDVVFAGETTQLVKLLKTHSHNNLGKMVKYVKILLYFCQYWVLGGREPFIRDKVIVSL